VRPLVLVTAAVDGDVSEYESAVRESGADPLRADAADPDLRVLDRVQGLLVSGGDDVDPAAYGGPPDETEPADPQRDAFEFALVRAARERAMPTFAICRGLQVANVAFGGTLIADIPEALGDRDDILHRRWHGGRSERGLLDDHVVRIEEDSALFRIVGTTELVTGGRHHQAVLRCADDLRIVGSTSDGIVEALEARFASPFWLAVQWHPESTRVLDAGASRALFAAFADAARAYNPVIR
jgi:putative glutamine amidotransferase